MYIFVKKKTYRNFSQFKETELDNAKDRACLALQIVQLLSSLERTDGTEANGSGDGDNAIKKTVEFIREFVQPVEIEEQEYAGIQRSLYKSIN